MAAQGAQIIARNKESGLTLISQELNESYGRPSGQAAGSLGRLVQ